MDETIPTTGYSSPAQAEAALTSAFTPPTQTVSGYGGLQFQVPGSLTAAQQAAIRNAASLVPTPTVSTSNTAVEEVTAAQDKLSSEQQRMAEASTSQPQAQETRSDDQDILDMVIGKPEGDKIPSMADQIAAIDQTVNNVNNLIDPMIARMDERSARMMETIKNRFEQRRNQQEAINKAVLGGTRVAGLRSGRARYATEIQDSIMAAEESAGLQRLAELDLQEQQFLLEAEAANDEKTFKLLSEKMSAYENAQREKRQVVLDLYKMTQENEQMAIQRAREAREQIMFEREQAEADALNLAVSNFDELINEDGSFNEDLLNQMSADTGIEPAMIGRMVKEIERENEASLPALVREHKYAQENGFKGDFMAYQAARASAGRAIKNDNVITLEMALENEDIPISAVGLSVSQFVSAMTNEQPPEWFRGYIASQDNIFGRAIEGNVPDENIEIPGTDGEYVPSLLKSFWDEFRSQTAIVLESSGRENKPDSDSELDSAIVDR